MFVRLSALTLLLLFRSAAVDAADLSLARTKDGSPRNIIFVLADDHRADALGFLGHPIVETPISIASPAVVFISRMQW